jgi:phosphate:Na+ symporter
MNNILTLSFIYITSGILLFLFALDQIKINLNTLFISKLHYYIQKTVNTKFKSFLIGCIASALIQSSSGVTAIAITLLSSKFIKQRECLGIIIGANLGTCLTTFIIAINISNIFLYILILGIFLYFLFNKYRKYSILIIYIGLMLLGLDILNIGFDKIINNSFIYNIINNIQTSNTLSILFGIFSTAIIQSSSGLIGIVEQMYFNSLINLNSSILIMLGANIGTTITGYLATINTQNNTKTIINLNLIFNIIGVLIFIIIFPLFIKHITYMENLFFINNVKFSVAYAHFIFNLVSVILGYIFFSLFDRILTMKSEI